MKLPSRFLETEKIAPDTYVLRQLFGEGFGPVGIHVNSMVITGAEPVIVDTGPALTRAAWLEHAFEVVDPADVRWIFLSHDDGDHTGNLHQVLEAAPNATLVSNWFGFERMSLDHEVPLRRMRWINDGESFHVGDRDLVAVLPPVFDSPTTRGLFDPRTGVYWAGDAFGSPVTHEVTDVTELDPGFYRDAFVSLQRMISPWLRWVDPARYRTILDRVAGLGATTLASAHGVTLRGRQIDSALDLMTELPYLPPYEWPVQADLDVLLTTVALEAA
ncbi:MAG: MBL fold metallo-hydrolase [Actinobacteria bacterium]|nr:MAG: MBL fold metallo-hydrolase [Actinomycetota bacterium]